MRCPHCRHELVEEKKVQCSAMVPPGYYKSSWTRCAKFANTDSEFCTVHSKKKKENRQKCT